MDEIDKSGPYFEATSLCIANGSESIWRWTRVADIENGELMPFRYNPDEPFFYENRETLPNYSSQAPCKGDVTVFLWEDMPNRSNTDKVYTRVNGFIQSPIRIVQLDANTTMQAIAALRHGIAMGSSNAVVIYSFGDAASHKCGLLCAPEDMMLQGNVYKLISTVAKLPYYNLWNRETLTIQGNEYGIGTLNYTFLKTMDPGIPDGYIQTRDAQDVVKDKILHNRALSWNAFRDFMTSADGSRTYTHKELNLFKDLLAKISDTTLCEEIAQAIGCSVEEAQNYLDDFIEHANQYLEGTETDTALLSRLVVANDALREKYTALVKALWKKEESQKIAESQKRLDDLQEDYTKQSQILERTNQNIKKSSEHLEELQRTIQENETLAEQSYQRVQERLSAARANVSDFLSDLSIYWPTSHGCTSSSNPENSGKFFGGGRLDDVEAVEDWEAILDAIVDNLEAVGVSKAFRRTFAAFLYSAYLNQVPLLLAGPAAEEIAHAFSAAVFGQLADELHCNGSYNDAVAKEALASAGVLIVRNPFCKDWLQPLIRGVCRSSKTVLFVHPFTEDLLIEPQSLFFYLLPVFTEDIVDQDAIIEYLEGTVLSNTGEAFKSTARHTLSSNVMSKVGFSQIMQHKIQKLVSDAQSMTETTAESIVYPYVLKPYAAATGRGRQLCSYMKSLATVPQDIKTSIYHYFDYEEE